MNVFETVLIQKQSAVQERPLKRFEDRFCDEKNKSKKSLKPNSWPPVPLCFYEERLHTFIFLCLIGETTETKNDFSGIKVISATEGRMKSV